MGESSSKLSLKLVIDKKANKAVFAEAGKDAVDFLRSILTLPVGMVTKLLPEQGMAGCLPNLVKSIQNLNDDCGNVQLDQHKDTFLKATVLYRCPTISDHFYVTNKPGTRCPGCQFNMNICVTFVEGDTAAEMLAAVGGDGGLIKAADPITYTVTYDLVVSSASVITSVSCLKILNVNVKSLEEKVVDLDMDKGLKLLKASFQSKNALTEVFLKGQDNMQKRKTGCFVGCRTFVFLILVIFLMGFIGALVEKK